MHRPNRNRGAALAATTAVMAAALVLHGRPASAQTSWQGAADVTTLTEGAPGVDEVQTVAIDATGGAFELTYEGDTTIPLAFDAPAVDVEAALVDLAGIGAGNLTVTGDAALYEITFTGALAATDVADLTVDALDLTGDTPTATTETTTSGQAKADEVQRLRVRGTDGTYTITFDDQTTPPLAIDLTADNLQATLTALPGLSPDDLAITGGPGDRYGTTPYTITFTGALAHVDIAPLTTDPSNLTATAGDTLDVLPPRAAPTAWSTRTGQVVGINYANSRGWSWTPEGGYVELPSLGRQITKPLDVNDRGEVVGWWSEVGDLTPRPFLWSAAEGMRELGDLSGRQIGKAKAINNQGAVVGWTNANHALGEAFFWSEQTGMIHLGTLPISSGPVQSVARDVNDAGQVVGSSFAGAGLDHAFSWTQEGGMIDLGTLGGDAGGELGWGARAEAVNESGVVVGSALTAIPRPGGVLTEQHAFTWTESGGMVDLGGGESAHATLVNEAGQVAGGTCGCGNGGSHAFVASAENGLTVLGDLGGGDSFASVLGESGAVLGRSTISPDEGKEHGFYWDPEVGMVDLENPSAPSANPAGYPFALRDTGEILAFTGGAPPTGQESIAVDEPVGIVYWPDAGPGQPDQTIRASSPRTFVGARVYNTTGADQAATASTRPGATATFVVRTTNTGARATRFTLRGPTSPPGFQVRYLADGRDVTHQVTAGTYRTSRVEPQDHHDLTVRVTVSPTTPVGRTSAFKIRATNTTDTTRTDTAKAKVVTTRR